MQACNDVMMGQPLARHHPQRRSVPETTVRWNSCEDVFPGMSERRGAEMTWSRGSAELLARSRGAGDAGVPEQARTLPVDDVEPWEPGTPAYQKRR